jgi:hypothetical protein
LPCCNRELQWLCSIKLKLLYSYVIWLEAYDGIWPLNSYEKLLIRGISLDRVILSG